jgi:hypothetical protein
MKNDEIQYRWEHCEPIEGVAFLANDRAVVIDEFRGAIAATALALRAIDPEPEYEVMLDAGGERLFRRQSALVSPVPENMGECVAWIQKWYSAQCDGEWEHDLGVAIGTLDNPGWSVKIDLKGTNLDGTAFEELSRLGSGRAFLSCKVTENRFEGAGGPHMLGEILATFVRWAQAHSRSG